MRLWVIFSSHFFGGFFFPLVDLGTILASNNNTTIFYLNFARIPVPKFACEVFCAFESVWLTSDDGDVSPMKRCHGRFALAPPQKGNLGTHQRAGLIQPTSACKENLQAHPESTIQLDLHRQMINSIATADETRDRSPKRKVTAVPVQSIFLVG